MDDQDPSVQRAPSEPARTEHGKKKISRRMILEAVIVIGLLVVALLGWMGRSSAQSKVAKLQKQLQTSALENARLSTQFFECKNALDVASEAFDALSGYPPLVGRAAEAADTGDLTELSKVLDDGTAINNRLTEIVPRYQAATASCKG